MLCRANASSVSQVGLDAATDSVLFFVTGGVSFCSGVDAPEVLDGEPKVTPPSLVYTPSDLTSVLRALLNGQLSGRSGLGIPAGLKMGEGVVELILFAEDIARAQSHAPID